MTRLAHALALAALAVLALSPGPAAAAADPPPDLAEAGEDIPPDEWRAIAAGRTVWYRIGDSLWGRERYALEADRVVFQFPDGMCVEGAWTYVEPFYCFDFGPALAGDGPHCFRHVRHEGALWVIGLAGDPQAVDRIDSTPLACGPDVVS